MDTTWAIALLLAAARCAGIFLAAPVFANSAVPVKLRLAISVVMALTVCGRLSGTVALAGPWELLSAMVVEAAIGAAIGYAARLLLAGLEMGAVYVSQQTGLALGAVLDANKEDSGDPLSRLMHILGVVIFLAIGGHRALVSSLLGSFELVPPTGAIHAEGALRVVVGLVAASFVMAVKIAAPVLIALIVAAVVGGLLHKTMPQFNLFTVGLPIRAMVGLLLFAAALAGMAPLLESATDAFVRQLPAALAAG